jgi:hypothetical protein
MAQGPTPFEFPYKDLPQLMEAFADDMHLMSFNWQFAHITLTIDRLEDVKPGQKPRGQKVTSARLVLTANALIKLVNSLNQIMGALEQSGAVKRQQPAIINPGTKAN